MRTSVCRVPWVSTTMSSSNGVLFAPLEVTMTKRGQVPACKLCPRGTYTDHLFYGHIL